VPSEFHSSGDGGGFGLHPIPSVIDLPSTSSMVFEVGGIGSGVEGVSNVRGKRDLKMRSGNGAAYAANGSLSNGHSEKNGNGSHGPVSDKESTGKEGQAPPVKHYDADGMFWHPFLAVVLYSFRSLLFSSYKSHSLRWHCHTCFRGAPLGV